MAVFLARAGFRLAKRLLFGNTDAQDRRDAVRRRVASVAGSFRVTADFSEVERALNRLQEDIDGAMVRTINTAAFRLAREEWPDIAERELDRPVPFTKKGARYAKANRANLTAEVYLRPEVERYLLTLLRGGGRVRRIVPASIRVNKHGNIPGLRNGRKVAALLAKKNHFRKTIKGIDAIWKSTPGRGLEPVLLFDHPIEIRKRLDFGREMERSAGPILLRAGRDEVQRAVSRFKA